jgi:beta-RFAP synthase
MTRVTAPSRLHFGLFHVPVPGATDGPVVSRSFGGVGLMIDQPGLVVTAKRADNWQFEGMLASRAQLFALRFMQSLPEAERKPFQVLVEQCPPEHTGLGVGTQLGLAVARALSEETGNSGLTAEELAARVGRGERSAVGVHGFDAGGLIVEPGKRDGEAISPLLTRVRLPDEWRVVVLTPPNPGPWHGSREREAFAGARTAGATDALCRIVLMEMLPAAIGDDLDGFGEAVYEFNRKAGEPFTAAQGGQYAGPEITQLVADVRGMGVRGVGQSSWGPSVFAVVGSEAEAVLLAYRFRSRARAVVARVSAGNVISHT